VEEEGRWEPRRWLEEEVGKEEGGKQVSQDGEKREK